MPHRVPIFCADIFLQLLIMKKYGGIINILNTIVMQKNSTELSGKLEKRIGKWQADWKRQSRK